MRSLVSIQMVKNITAIPESDFLEVAHIMGWQCVVKKGELAGKPYYITTKMDGTSGTVYCINGSVGCCSRNC